MLLVETNCFDKFAVCGQQINMNGWSHTFLSALAVLAANKFAFLSAILS